MTSAARRPLGGTGLAVFPLCLGTNVFGWTADEAASFAVLDAYAAGGGNFLDTADVYSDWVPGHVGGESEAVIGQWFAARGNRTDMVLGTKVGGAGGLGRANIATRVQRCLSRLCTDYIDILYAHFDDPHTPLEETLNAFTELVRDGKVRHVAASNYSAERLAEALAVSDRESLARYEVLQPLYNLMERDRFEGPTSQLCLAEGIAVLPYFGLARGFLTGKYRPGDPRPDSPRAVKAASYLDARGVAVLAALDGVAARHGVSVASVALAWLAAQPSVVAPLASARNPEQLIDLLASLEVTLQADEIALLCEAAQ